MTEDLPPIGGRLKEHVDDFVVEELPLYNPSGDGEHAYLFVEKQDLNAVEMVSVLAKHFGVQKSAVGYAGLKDRRAVTRQVVSVQIPGKRVEQFPSLEHPKIRVLWADHHVNKLKRGHLAGNRFSIRVRGVEATAALVARRALERIEREGLPDRFGEQRFGFLRNNHLIGRALYLRDYEEAVRLLLSPNGLSPPNQVASRERFAEGDLAAAARAMPRTYRTERTVLDALSAGEGPEQAFDAVEPMVLSYYFSSFQSAVFNAVLDERVEAGTLSELRVGDIAISQDHKHQFDVDEEKLADERVARRLAAMEIGPSGPMWGRNMRRTRGEIDRGEVAALERFGLRIADFERTADETLEMVGGTRRPLRVAVTNTDVEGGVDEHGSYVRCAFDLPRGAFATAVMGEIMKPDRVGGAGGVEEEHDDDRDE